MSESESPNATLHFGIAEQGKVHLLAGELQQALRHFREATRIAVEGGAEEVFFRHYTHCVLETLEQLGALDEILAFCERAEQHYAQNPPPHELARLDLATIRQRHGVILLKKGENAAARATLRAALEVAPGPLPLATAVLRWLDLGLHVDGRRLHAEQTRHNYFVVRADAVDSSRAVRLPDGIGTPALRR